MEIGKSWLETVLKRQSFENSPTAVADFKLQGSNIKKGQNFLSKIDRLEATAILGSGRRKKINFIVKNQHVTKHMKQFTLETGIFIREIMMFRDILPKMEDLLEEIGDTNDIPWGKCVDVSLYNRIVFEDLTASGYVVYNRMKQLGLQASLLVMKQLGKFHALSKILLDRGEIPMDIFGHHVWAKMEERNVAIHADVLTKYDKTMESWGEEWKEARERLQKAKPKITDMYHKTMKYDPSEFFVLNHGDCQTNNLMYRFGDDSEQPNSLKFIDFQLCFVNSPARDINYFLLLSVRQEVQLEHYDKLLQTYTDSLNYYLTQFKYEGFIPKVGDIKQMLDQRYASSLGEAIWLVPMLLSDHEDKPDIEEMMEKYEGAEKAGEGVDENYWSSNESKINTTIMQNTIKKSMELGII
ncbi:transferase activity, transferring phosphorus-containing groups [Nesidiocoris tenuis]|uniref:Transferase activity, transferring phosphorus-containing groups n=1 Tax=Nesidiocoris tenuis TaxID=355587 RepID=A0ABN7AU94_9HEMI|nr:transferase activity, transferring phosphorus-containing groups [Nesidiocoris tenuis]